MAKKVLIVIVAFTLVLTLALSGCAARRPMYTEDNAIDRGMDDVGIGNDDGNGYDYGYGNNGYNVGYYDDRGNNNRLNDNTQMGQMPNNMNGNNTSNSTLPNNNNQLNNNMGMGNRTGTSNLANTDSIERQCKAIKGVDDATVVMDGDTAYVGIDNNNLNNANMSKIKSECSQIVKGENPDIRNVYVSTENNYLDRLQKVSDGMRNGEMTEDIGQQLREMVRSLNPVR